MIRNVHSQRHACPSSNYPEWIMNSGPSEHHFLVAGMDPGQDGSGEGMSEPPDFTGSWPGTVQGQEWNLNKQTSPY